MADPERWLRHIHPDDRQRALDDEAVSKAGGRPLLSEYRMHTRDGDVVWLRDEAVMIADRNGVKWWQGFMIDISDQRRAEQAHRTSESRYRSLFDNVPFALYRTLPTGKLVDGNPALAHMLGYPDTDVLMQVQAIDLYVDAQDRRRWKELIEWEGIVDNFEARLRRRDGRIIWIRDTARAFRDDNGLVAWYEGALEDITDRKRAEEEARTASARLASWVEELERRNRDMTLIKELGDLLQACPSVQEAQEVIAHFGEILFAGASGALCLISPSRNLVEAGAQWRDPMLADSMFGPDDCWALRTGRLHAIADSSSRLRCHHVSSSLPGGALCVPMVAQGDALGILHVQYPPASANEADEGQDDIRRDLATSVAEHVSLALANLKLRETLRSQSIRDPLTALFNRRYMEESLDRELRRADRTQRPVGVIMLDFDHFTEFNNAHGHQAGDALLRRLGELLNTKIRGGDLACRYGGEEFTVILPEASSEAVFERAEQIRQETKRMSIELRDRSLGSVTMSLGVAMYPVHGRTAEEVIQAADMALYRAKNAGRDRVELADEPMALAPTTDVVWTGRSHTS
jgi:diguanylate cyclase (GGDEF)-like protein/PAS domain S-box-containing protein